ncbi:hypothetical protein [Muricoccus radiodurans]|uniref:hypothetical protein n=1 Tax=Muricoccus radiodurans TaxID=2231721 RepID=UPI003CEA0EDA
MLRPFGLAATLLATLTAPVLAQSQAPIGVPECDDFIARYEQCLSNNVPTASRAQVGAAVMQMRESWRAVAQSAQAREALGPQCVQLRQAVAQSMATYNCRF